MLLRQLLLDRDAEIFLRVLQHRGKQRFLRSQRMGQCPRHILHRRRPLLKLGSFTEGRCRFSIKGHRSGGEHEISPPRLATQHRLCEPIVNNFLMRLPYCAVSLGLNRLNHPSRNLTFR